MKKKVLATVLALSVIAPTAIGFTGCKKKVADDENTLQIFVSNFGYGTDWVDALITEFEKQDWVKDKYPNLNIPTPDKNSERTFPADRMITDGKTNTYDLLFACDSATANYDKKDGSGNLYFEDLSGLYATKVPGEGEVTFAQKMDDNILSNMQYTPRNSTKQTYYSVQWVNGYMGLLYNKTLVEKELGSDYALPKTTIQLEGMAKDLKAKGETPFISSSKAGYWSQISYTWWVQYEGTARYEDYWLGVDTNDETTSDNFKQLGRLRSLETLEGLIHESKGYNHDEVNTAEFTEAQSLYLLGEAMMMPNGDWFEQEMRSNYEEDKNHYDIRFMQLPVMSAIVENMDLYEHEKAYSALTDAEKNEYDAKLAAIIAVVDADGTYEDAQAAVAGLTEKDFKKVNEARRVVYSVENHEGYIPAYATGKEIAKDFLLFMATDKGIETFMRATNGASTAFEYDVQTKAPDLYASFSTLQQSRAAIAKKGIVPFQATTSPLVYWGGLSYYLDGALESYFTRQNANDRKTAKQIYDNDIDYYITKNNGGYWGELLTRAGIQ